MMETTSKTINQLEGKIRSTLDEMNALLSTDMTEVEMAKYDAKKAQLDLMEDRLKRAKEQADENAEAANKLYSRGDTFEAKGKEFYKWLKDVELHKDPGAFRINFSSMRRAMEAENEGYNLLRADPILSTTNPSLTIKTVAPIDTMYTPSQQIIEALGVEVMDKLHGEITIPRLEERVATFATENTDVSSADINFGDITMKPRMLGLTQKISKLALLTYRPDTMKEVLYNMEDACWNAILGDLCDTVETDCSTRISNFTGGPISLTDLTNMEASLGGLYLARPAYLMRPETKAYLKRTKVLDNEFLWNKENKVNGYSSYATPYANIEKVILGDWSKAVLGIWGDGLEVVINPFTDATKGVVSYTVMMFVDTAIKNPNGFVIMNDASTF